MLNLQVRRPHLQLPCGYFVDFFTPKMHISPHSILNHPKQLVEEDKMPSSSISLNSQKFRRGIALVPNPSDDRQDPLVCTLYSNTLSLFLWLSTYLPQNWSQRRKYTVLAILCLSAFSGLASSLANQLGFVAQAKLYQKELVEVSYSVSMIDDRARRFMNILTGLKISSAIAGLAFGPLLLVPFAHVIGRSALIWWSLIGCLCCGVWAARMTGPDDYISFVLSRLFGGIFGSIPSILGAGIIVDIFFLHERGKAFTTFSLSFLLGTVAGPTFGGFIVQRTAWSNEFWWTVGLQGFVIVLGGL